MSKAVYIATSEPNSGKSIVTLAVMRLLTGRAARVGYFRPIIDDYPKGVRDNHIDTVLTYFNLNQSYEETYACTRSEVIQQINQDQADEVVDIIFEKYKELQTRFEFVLVEGTDFSREGSVIEWDFNVLIAQNLGIPAILLGNASGKSPEELAGYLNMAYDSFQSKGVEVLLVVANKLAEEHLEVLRKTLGEQLPPEVIIGGIPYNPQLGNPTLQEIVEVMEGEVLFGHQHLHHQAGNFGVGAMQLHNYLTYMKEDILVITPGDRSDIILGALQANLSSNYPSVSGIILSGGLQPETSVIKLIEGLSEVVPVVSVEGGTFEVAKKIGDIKPRIYAENTQKINTSIKDFFTYISEEELAQRLVSFESSGMSPRMFKYTLLKKAQSDKKHIVLPEGTDPRILEASRELLLDDAVDITLLGDPEQIRVTVQNLDIGLDLDKVNMIDPVKSPYCEEYADTLYELRKHKNLNPAMARDLMADVSYFGTMMVYKGHVDGMVSGAAHTTQHTVRPALQFIKSKPGISVVSSVFFMCLEDRVTVFGDCAINPNPTAQELAEIAISSADTSMKFGIDPKIAMLSYSSGSSGAGADVDKVRKATEIVKERRPDLLVEGPIQYDAAVDKEVAKSKLPDSPVAGQASVFIFPDLNTGNNTYKAVQRETKALAIGPLIQGLKKPVNDLSRGCTVDDIINTVIITAVQAQE